MEVMAGPEEFVADEVLIETDPNLPDVVAEEVVIDPSGGSSETLHFYQCQQVPILLF
jgi:hypothetical protein